LGHPRPYNPKRVAYFIQAPNKIPAKAAEPIRATPIIGRKATFSDLGEVDGRGYIYNLDRAGSGLTTSGFTPSRSACRPWRSAGPWAKRSG